MSAVHTWVTHPETGGVWACPNDALEVQLRRGWVKCEAPKADDSHLHDPKPQKAARRTSGD